MAVSNNNVKNVKFLRNAAVLNSREAAYNALTGYQLSDEMDGTAILSRYSGQTGDVKTLVGIIYSSGATKTITIFDVEGASADVEALRTEINNKLGTGVTSANTATAQLEALSGTSSDGSGVTSVWGAKAYTDDKIDEIIAGLDGGVTAETGYYVKSVSEVDGKISGTTEALPTVAAVSGDGQAITAVSQTNGTVAAVAGDISAGHVTVTAFTATNVQGALEEVSGGISTAIDGLDYTGVTTGAGVYVTNVTEENGVVSATTATLPSVSDTAVAKKFVTSVSETNGQIAVTKGTVSSTGNTVVLTDNADGGINIEVASSALIEYVGDNETIEVSAAVNNQKTISTLLTLSSITPSSTTVKEEYALVDASGVTKGQTVKIYKDSSVVSIEYITDPDDPHYQNLEYTYVDNSGNTQTEYVDMSTLVLEAEFASGVTVDASGVAHGVVDPTSESFLTVGADGFKVSGISGLVTNAVEGLDATVTGATSGSHVTISIEELDGKLVQSGLTIEESDIASASDLAALSAKTVTEVSSSNSSISATTGTAADGTVSVDLVTDASKVKMTGFTADESGFTTITTASTVTEAVKAIETEFLANEATVSAALNNLEEDKLENIVVNGVTGTVADKIATVTIDGADIKLDGYTAGSTGNVASTDSVNVAISKLENAISGASSGSSAALDNEIAHRKAVDGIDGDAYSANTTANYISAATSLNDADQKLDAAIKAVSDVADAAISGATMNGSGLTPSNGVLPFTAVASTTAGTATGNEAIVITTDGNGGLTFALDTIDCGTY